jgi:hypothetical protein
MCVCIYIAMCAYVSVYKRFEVLLLVTLQITVFCDMSICHQVDSDGYVRGTYCLHLQVPPEADFAVLYCFMHYYVALN